MKSFFEQLDDIAIELFVADNKCSAEFAKSWLDAHHRDASKYVLLAVVEYGRRYDELHQL